MAQQFVDEAALPAALNVLVAGVIGVDAQAALFVDVGVADRDDDWVYADIHHHDVKELQRQPRIGDGDDVEATRANGEGLKEAVKEFNAGR